MSRHLVTAEEIKKWLDKFGDTAIVEYEMDCAYGITYLTIPYGTVTEKFNLTTGEATSEDLEDA